MKFDRYDNPKVGTTGVEVGPASQMPTSVRTGVAAIEEGASAISGAIAVFREEREKANLFKSRQNELAFAEEANVIENEFRARQGESGMDTAEVREKIEALRQKHAQDLQSDDARADYDQRTRLRKLVMDDGLEKHAADQRVKVYGAVADKALLDMRTAAVRDYNNPEKVEQALSLGLSTMMEYLSGHLGLPDAKVDEVLEKAQAQVYVDVLNAYKSNEQFSAGKEYLARVKEDLGPVAEEWQGAFNKLSEAAEVEALATSAWSWIEDQATDSVTGRFSPKLARAALIERYTPEQRVKIEKDINAEIAIAVGAQNEEDTQKVSRLLKSITLTGGFSRTSKDYTNLDDEGQAKVEHAAEVARKVREEGSRARILQNAINKIGNDLYTQQDPALRREMTEAQIRSLTPGMDEVGVQSILARQATEKQAANKKMVATEASFHKKLFDVMPLLKKNMPGVTGERLAESFKDQMTAWWYTEAADGTPPTRDEVNKRFGQELLMMDLSFWKGRKPAYMLTPEQRAAAEASAMEDQVYEDAKALLRGDYDKPSAEAPAAVPTSTKAPEGFKSGEEWMKKYPGMKLNPSKLYRKEGGQLISIEG